MKIGPFLIEQCNQKIGEWLMPILPVQTQTPDTKITFHVKENSDGSVKWSVEFDQSISDFAKMIIGGPLPKPKKIDQLLIIGDEVLPNGLWILYSEVDQQMIRLKFETEVEALAFRNANTENYADSREVISHYEPEKISRAMSVDPWWDGSVKNPSSYGFRKVVKGKEGV